MGTECYRVREAIIIRDERQAFDCGWYLVADPSRPISWHFDKHGYRLLEYLIEPRTSDDIQRHRDTLPVGNPLSAPTKMSAFFQAMQRMGIIEQVSRDAASARPVCAAHRPVTTKYAPASAPVSTTVRLPMDANLFAGLTAEIDELGVFGVNFLGGRQALEFLSSRGNALRSVRAAISLRLAPDNLDEDAQQKLSAIGETRGRPPFVILEKDGATETIVPTARKLKELSVPFCITQQVVASDDLGCLTKMTSEVLSAGASFTLFLLNQNGVAADHSSTLAAIEEKVALLQQIQDAYDPNRVQVRGVHTPLPRSVIPGGASLSELFSQYFGGCSVGLVAGSLSSEKRPIGIGILPPEKWETLGPALAPNCCQAGLTYLAVDSDGTVYPCEEAVGLPELAMGSLTTKSLADIWASERWEFFRGGWDLHELSGCYGCELYVLCACRRCRVYPLKSLGDRFMPMPICLKCADELKPANPN